MVNKHHDVLMRTTLTIDPEIFRRLKEISYRERKAFKEVVNQTLKAGLDASNQGSRRKKKFKVEPLNMGFKPGIDQGKLNQLADQLEAERYT